MHRYATATLLLLSASAAFAQGGFSGVGRYEITNAENRKVIDLDRNDQRTVLQFDPRGTANQIWEIRRGPGDSYFLFNTMNGMALEQVTDKKSTPVTASRFHGGASQQWRLEGGKNGSALIVSMTGKAIDVPDGSKQNGTKLQVYDKNGDGNQQFLFRRTGELGPSGGGPGIGRGAGMAAEGRAAYAAGAAAGVAAASGQATDEFGQYWDARDRMWKLDGDGVCFYTERDFGGEAACARVGVERRTLLPRFNNRISSLKFFGRSREVQVFALPNFGGRTGSFMRDVTDFRQGDYGYSPLNDNISSFRVN